jgi:hypothetical protein
VQELETALGELATVLDINASTGQQLDNIGELVGQPREGRSDADYRAAIRSKIATNVSSGTPDEVIETFKTLTGSTSVVYREEFPAGFSLYGDGTLPDGILEAIDDAAPAAVGIGILDDLIWDDGDDVEWDDGTTAVIVLYSNEG